MSALNGTGRQVVLVVEDEPVILMVISDELRDAGFDVIEAMDAESAVDILESRNDITVLFTDVALPGRMDGLMLSAMASKRWPEVRIIVTSGHVRLMLDGLPSGGRFFAKPYNAGALVEAIRDVSAA